MAKKSKTPSRPTLYFLVGIFVGVGISAAFISIKNSVPAVKIEPRSVSELVSAAADAFQSKNYDLAIKRYRDVLTQDPNNYDANTFLATMLVEYSKPPQLAQALPYMEKSLELKDDYREKIYYAYVLSGVSKYAESEIICRKLIKENSKDANAWNYFGWSLHQQGKNVESLIAYEKAIHIDPNHKDSQEMIKLLKNQKLK